MGHGVRSNRGKVDPGAKEGKYLLTFVDDNGVVHEVQTEYVVLVSVASDDSETRQLILLSSIRVKAALCIVCPLLPGTTSSQSMQHRSDIHSLINKVHLRALPRCLWGAFVVVLGFTCLFWIREPLHIIRLRPDSSRKRMHPHVVNSRNVMYSTTSKSYCHKYTLLRPGGIPTRLMQRGHLELSDQWAVSADESLAPQVCRGHKCEPTSAECHQDE